MLFLFVFLIPVMIGFEWPLDRYAKVIGLLLCQLGKFHTQLIEVQTGNFFIKV